MSLKWRTSGPRRLQFSHGSSNSILDLHPAPNCPQHLDLALALASVAVEFEVGAIRSQLGALIRGMAPSPGSVVLASPCTLSPAAQQFRCCPALSSPGLVTWTLFSTGLPHGCRLLHDRLKMDTLEQPTMQYAPCPGPVFCANASR